MRFEYFFTMIYVSQSLNTLFKFKMAQGYLLKVLFTYCFYIITSFIYIEKLY